MLLDMSRRVTELRLWTRLALIAEYLLCVVVNAFSLCLLHSRETSIDSLYISMCVSLMYVADL